ncbi:MAG: hypothetical protein KGN36_09545, partial [Acidobacteriota bacterium]|nr:hypothetical protein [Acidobacteriota bacterium]
GRVAVLLWAAAGGAKGADDAARRLEAAIHREVVAGDVAGAIDLYRGIAADASAPREVAARALLEMGQCQEKLGQRRDAHATYSRVLREFASDAEAAAQARARLAGWTDALPGPRNLRFEQGDVGKMPPGWFVPALEKTTGSLAELRHKGCRGEGGCAVVVAPATAPGAAGNLMQSFSAAGYRGKTVRLRAWLKVEAASPEDRAQLWVHVLRPNGKPGFLDNMDDRPVRPAGWTPCEIVADVDGDALFLEFGVTAIGRGRVWVDDVAFDVVPEEQIAAARTAIRRQYGDRSTLTSFRFAGQQAVAAVRSLSTREGFDYVETYQDTWERTSDGWSLAQRVSLASYFEAPEPDPETVRGVAAEVRRLASPLAAMGAPVSSDCYALHRAGMPAGASESVLAAAGLGAFHLDLGAVPAASVLGRWLAEPHLFGGRPVTLAQSCRGLVFVEAGGEGGGTGSPQFATEARRQ